MPEKHYARCPRCRAITVFSDKRFCRRCLHTELIDIEPAVEIARLEAGIKRAIGLIQRAIRLMDEEPAKDILKGVLQDA